ncbi:MAG: hypothetical protein ACFBRM_15145 [Pikeienuella sp.]
MKSIFVGVLYVLLFSSQLVTAVLADRGARPTLEPDREASGAVALTPSRGSGVEPDRSSEPEAPLPMSAMLLVGGLIGLLVLRRRASGS